MVNIFFLNESWNSTPVYLIEIYYQDYMTFLIVNLRNNIKSDGQQFHQYQQNWTTIYYHELKKTTTFLCYLNTLNCIF